jgi:galactonate dehydratase
VSALSAVEIALWDLTGKAVGLPVYQLLGGRVRERVRVYCDSGLGERAMGGGDRRDEKIQQIKDLGFTAAKLDIDDGGDRARFDRVNWTASNGEIDNMVQKRRMRRAFSKGDGHRGRHARPVRHDHR